MTMPSDSPLPPERVPAIVDSLEPDLAAAYRAGNSVVIQAVSAGATTTAMVVNDMIRQGVITGLPTGVQELVTARIKEIQEQQNAENDRLRKLAAAVAGAAIMATAPAEGMYYGGEGQRDYMANPPTAAEFAQMSEAQKTAYFGGLKTMSMDSWLGLEPPQRVQHIDNTRQDGTDRMLSASATAAAIADEIKARYSKADSDRIHDVYIGLDLRDPAQVKEAQERLRALGQDDPKLAADAQRLLAANIELVNGAAQAGHGNEAKISELGGNSREAKHEVDAAITAREHGTAAAAAVRMDPTISAAQLQATAGKINAAQADGDGLQVDSSSRDVSLRAADAANLAARAKVDGLVAKADAQTLTQADEYDSPAPQTASAAPRLTINAAPLAAAGMLQPEGVAAANDPKSAAVEPERPRVTTPAQGMGA